MSIYIQSTNSGLAKFVEEELNASKFGIRKLSEAVVKITPVETHRVKGDEPLEEDSQSED